MNFKLGRARILHLLAFLLLLSGCATTQDLSEENRKKIGDVRISSDVQKAPAMYYLGPGVSTLLMFGPIGGAALAAASMEPAMVLKEFAEKNGIFIEKIAFQEIDAAIRQSGRLKVSDSGDEPKASIRVLVYQYGFSVPNGFSSNLVPIVAIKCEMVHANGNIIWSASDSVGPLGNPASPMAPEAMRDDPRRIEDAWRIAAKRIAGNIAKTL